MQSRITAHKRALFHGTHKNPRLQKAWDRDGEGAFVFLRLFECAESAVRQLEGLVLQACRPVYNLTMSVDGSTRLSDETRRRLSETHRGVPKSAAHRRHIGEAHKGRLVSAETRAKLSVLKTGTKLTAEHRRKIAEGLKGRVASDLARKHMSDAQKGHPVSLKVRQRLKGVKLALGLRRSAETKQRMSASMKASWIRRRGTKEI